MFKQKNLFKSVISFLLVTAILMCSLSMITIGLENTEEIFEDSPLTFFWGNNCRS